MTWRFWRALKNPPSKDPLFQRTMANYTPPRRKRLLAAGLILLVAFEFSLGLLGAVAPALQSVALILSLIPPGLLLAMTFNSTPYATIWAVTICGAIARERELRRYDLLCALPPGVMGTCMTICAGCLSRDQTFKNLPRLDALPIKGKHLVAAALLIPLFFVAYGQGDMQTDLVILLVYIACVAIGFYVDYIQSAVLASLTGMLVSTYISSQLDARLYGGLAFLTIQISTYGITLLAGIVAAPMLFSRAGITGLLADMSVPITALVVFCCAREGIIIGLSGLVNHRLKTA